MNISASMHEMMNDSMMMNGNETMTGLMLLMCLLWTVLLIILIIIGIMAIIILYKKYFSDIRQTSSKEKK